MDSVIGLLSLHEARRKDDRGSNATSQKHQQSAKEDLLLHGASPPLNVLHCASMCSDSASDAHHPFALCNVSVGLVIAPNGGQAGLDATADYVRLTDIAERYVYVR